MVVGGGGGGGAGQGGAEADPEKKKGGGWAWDRSYLVPMRYYLRFEVETSTPRHCLLGAEQALQLLDCVSSSPCFTIQASI